MKKILQELINGKLSVKEEKKLLKESEKKISEEISNNIRNQFKTYSSTKPQIISDNQTNFYDVDKGLFPTQFKQEKQPQPYIKVN